LQTNEYLYGNETPLNIPPEVIQDRIYKLDKNLTELLKVDTLERDTSRINAVVRAKAFWEKINEV
jgi:hypothetical protein